MKTEVEINAIKSNEGLKLTVTEYSDGKAVLTSTDSKTIAKELKITKEQADRCAELAGAEIKKYPKAEIYFLPSKEVGIKLQNNLATISNHPCVKLSII